MRESFFLLTLGCKVNQYETHCLREAWLRSGLREAASPGEAGIILLNSCAVTAKAVADVRNCTRRLHRAAPGAAIIIAGCAAELLQKELATLPGVLRVIGQKDKAALLDLEAWTAGAAAGEDGRQSAARAFPAFSLSGYDRSRAVLKIQDGCSHGCAFCVVPRTRGGPLSRPFDQSLAEARRLLQSGFREIIVSGVNLRQYEHADKGDFWDFLAALDSALAPEWSGRARLRISSLDPGQLGQKSLDTLASCRLIAPHLHLSLQSASPTVLERMRRGHYHPDGIAAFTAGLRRIWPVFGLGADVLTAFPGESEDEFARSMDFCQALPLTYAHVFPYSRRPGTAAASMPGQIPAARKKERAALLRGMMLEKKRAFLRSLLELPELGVVFERRAKGTEEREELRGVNEFYAECRLEPDAGPGRLERISAEIIAALPLRLDGETLVVGLGGKR